MPLDRRPGERPSTRARAAIVVSEGSVATTTRGSSSTAGAVAALALEAESSARAARMTAMEDRTYAKFTFFKIDPAWRRRDDELRAADKREFLAACEDFAVDRSLRAYSTIGTRGDVDLVLLSQSPRYSQTVAQADTASGFAKGLQKAGYATDPAYADKLTKVINTALRVQRSMA